MNWDGKTERRQLVEEQLRNLQVEMAAFKAKVEEWMSGTTEYRKSLCSKQDIIIERLGKLPCDKRSGYYTQIKAQWGLLMLIVGAIIVEWFKK